MTFLLSLFIISGLALLFLIIHKEIELAYGRGLIMKTIAHKTDAWLHGRVDTVRSHKDKLTRQNMLVWSRGLFVHLLRFTLGMFGKLRKSILKLIDKMEKKQVSLGQPGAASFYLKQIAESKESNKALTEK